MAKKKLKIKLEGKTIVEFYATKEEEEIAKNLVKLVKKKYGKNIKVSKS